MALLFLSFTACERFELNGDTDELISAIEDATDVTAVSADALPESAQSTLNSDYAGYSVFQSFYAKDLGYVVDLVSSDLTEVDIRAYFDQSGEHLERGRDRGSRDSTDCNRYGHHGDAKCFDFVYPISYTMPDNSVITGDSAQEIRVAISSWYDANPGIDQKPSLVFPVDIIFRDSTILNITQAEDLRAAQRRCKRKGGDHRPCFDLNFPLSFTMPDGSTLTGNDKEELLTAFKAWYDANPGVDERPDLTFPIDITLDDGTVLTIQDEQGLRDAKANCD